MCRDKVDSPRGDSFGIFLIWAWTPAWCVVRPSWPALGDAAAEAGTYQAPIATISGLTPTIFMTRWTKA